MTTAGRVAPVAKSPAGASWTMVNLASGLWRHVSGIQVISKLEVVPYPDDETVSGPQWHVSVTRAGKRGIVRPYQSDVDLALADFDMVGAEEDNHEPGMARHFWMPVDPAHRVDCQCKADEDLIVEPDGHTWTNPKSGEGLCRGCEQELLFARKGLPPRPCPIHSKGVAL